MKKTRARRKVKNLILECVTAIAAVATLFSACCMDSECWGIPVCIMTISVLWLFIFSFANGFFDFD